MVEHCCYCGISMNDLPQGITYTKDHLVPKCKGGNNSVENLKPCCSKCNSEKGSRTINQYIIFLEKEVKKIDLYIGYSSLKHIKQQLETKIKNAKDWGVYISCMGRRLYRNDKVMKQWRKDLWNTYIEQK